MASVVWTPRWSAFEPAQHRTRSRPVAIHLRTHSESGPSSPGLDDFAHGARPRHKSSTTFDDVAPRSPQSASKSQALSATPLPGEERRQAPASRDATAGADDEDRVLTPPTSPSTTCTAGSDPSRVDDPQVASYDFSRIDYELQRAKVLGQGLWSTVYLAEHKPAPRRNGSKLPTPPTTPAKLRVGSASGLYAVKLPARRDAKEVFNQEARVLCHLQRRLGSSQYMVPFHGLDGRNHALVFEAVIGGSLESLVGRLKQMTEVARHLELIAIFPGLAGDLISGLDFLHTSGVVHADIKPANVLLDVSEHRGGGGGDSSSSSSGGHPTVVLRARYIDFSAAFLPLAGDDASNAGGTWDLLAPEQMRLQKEWNTPTCASDIWSLGITLLWILVGGSPYAAACGDNRFMLREAIKSGDPLGFARMDAVPHKRLAACQDFVDCCRLALKKDRDKRITAGAWVKWLEDQQMGI